VSHLRAVPKPKAPEQRPEHLRRVREKACCVCYAPPPSEAHHFGRRGVGQKCDDCQTVPLCRLCHQRWHSQGSCSPFPRSETIELFLRAQVDLLIEALEASS
jgi:hypothetical protein